MTDQDPDSLPYEKAAPNDYRWTSEAYEALVKGLMEASLTRQSDILTARVAVYALDAGTKSMSPRCSMLSPASDPRRSTRPGGSAGVEAETEYVTVPAACQCGEPHEGRPDGKTAGCGINFLVDIEMPR